MNENVKFILFSFLSRSGSTFISNNLSKDSRFCVCPEAEVLTRTLLTHPNKALTINSYKKLKRSVLKDHKLKYWKIELPPFTNEILNIELFKYILLNYRNNSNNTGNYIIFKSEGLEEFNVDIFSDFYKLILIRDPRSIFYSQKSSLFSEGFIPMNINPIRTAKKFNKIFKSHKRSSRKECFIKFENYIENPIKEEKCILKMLGLDALKINSNNTLQKLIPRNQLHLHINISKKPDKNVIDKWENNLSETEIFLIERYCIEMEAAGYNKKESLNSVSDIKVYIFLIRLFIIDIINKSVKRLLLFIH